MLENEIIHLLEIINFIYIDISLRTKIKVGQRILFAIKINFSLKI